MSGRRRQSLRQGAEGGRGDRDMGDREGQGSRDQEGIRRRPRWKEPETGRIEVRGLMTERENRIRTERNSPRERGKRRETEERLRWVGEQAGLTVALHLFQDGDPTLLLPWVVDEHALEDASRPEDLLGKDVKQQVVDSQVPLDTVLPHLAQGQVDEVHVAPLVHVVLPEVLHHAHEVRLVPRPFRCLLEQLLMEGQGLRGSLPGLRPGRDQPRVRVMGGCAAVEAPWDPERHLGTENRCRNLAPPRAPGGTAGLALSWERCQGASQRAPEEVWCCGDKPKIRHCYEV